MTSGTDSTRDAEPPVGLVLSAVEVCGVLRTSASSSGSMLHGILIHIIEGFALVAAESGSSPPSELGFTTLS